MYLKFHSILSENVSMRPMFLFSVEIRSTFISVTLLALHECLVTVINAPTSSSILPILILFIFLS